MNDEDDEQLLDSDEDIDWEEVPIEAAQQDLEITLSSAPVEQIKGRTISHAERLLRIGCHKLHTLCLLSNARVRNQWLNDELLHARLMSLTPMALQINFTVIHKSRYPEAAKRGRLFESALNKLVEWWAGVFFEPLPEGHIRNRSFENIRDRMQRPQFEDKDLNIDVLEDMLDDEGETIRSSKSLMKHALMQSGSRDTSAQLFTALCRGLGLPTRLVVSLQSVPWKVGIDKPKAPPKDKGKGKMRPTESIVDEPSNGDFTRSDFPGGGQRLGGGESSMSEKAKGKQKAQPAAVKLRKTQSKGKVLGRKPKPKEDPLNSPPIFWTEVFSRPDGRWIPVDPLRGIVNNRKCFDPPPASTENRLVYVLAFEEDGYARDITRKYARQFTSKVRRVQGGSTIGGGGKGRAVWWETVVTAVTRPYRLLRDDVEDEEMNSAQFREGMPTSMTGFKDHPLYVIPRHLKQNETIYPPPPDTPELGTFRGEPVYSRSAVVSLKAADTWMRTEGRTVKQGAHPLKLIKMRTGTINRQREMEILKDGLKEAGADATQEMMQGLYGRMQTEPYIPPPVVNGIIPKNDFGNIDLYVPSMLPRGAVHIPYKGVQKIARKLGINYAEAVTGFEFKKRRAFPVVEGVVIASENEQMLLDAFWESEQDAKEKARLKRVDKAIKQWTRLIHGLRIRQRLQDQYANKHTDASRQESPKPEDGEEPEPEPKPSGSGGFLLAGADDVVFKYTLPKYQHVQEEKSMPVAGPSTLSFDREEEERITYEMETMDLDVEPLHGVASVPTQHTFVPKTMAELAEERNDDAANGRTNVQDDVEEWGDDPSFVKPPETSKGKGKAPARTAKGKAKAKAKKATTPKRTGTKRKRPKKDDDDHETPDEAEMDGEVAPVAKKPRTRAKLSQPAVAPTRTLRPRKSKTAEEIEKEKEHDAAWKDALGEELDEDDA